MGQNFLGADREQPFLLPPDIRDWLPEGHFAWFVIDAVAQMDLDAFYSAYRQDGHGRAAFEPAMMVGLLLYADARGIRSSRVIERSCEEDVAFRVVVAHQRPDHTTIARFRQRHQEALAGLFGEVLALCAEAGLVDVKVVAVDGTKVHANASERATRDYEQLAREVLADADAVDAEEDERFGDRRGDELPEPLGTREGRARWLADAKRRLEQRRAQEAGRFRRRVRRDSARPSAGWKKSIASKCGPTPTTRPTELAASTRTARSSGVHRSRSLRRRRPWARSTPLIWTRAMSRLCAGGCRATTPKPSPRTGRSWSPPS
jgi:transposase